MKHRRIPSLASISHRPRGRKLGMILITMVAAGLSTAEASLSAESSRKLVMEKLNPRKWFKRESGGSNADAPSSSEKLELLPHKGHVETNEAEINNAEGHAGTSKNQLLSRPQPSAPPATGNPPSPGSGNPPPRPVRQSGANTQQTPPVQPAATANPTRPVINGGDPAQQGTTTTANGGGNGPPPRTHTNAESSEEEPASQETQTSGANKKASTIQKATLGVGIAGALGAGTASVLGGVVLANQQAANTTAPNANVQQSQYYGHGPFYAPSLESNFKQPPPGSLSDPALGIPVNWQPSLENTVSSSPFPQAAFRALRTAPTPRKLRGAIPTNM